MAKIVKVERRIGKMHGIDNNFFFPGLLIESPERELLSKSLSSQVTCI